MSPSYRRDRTSSLSLSLSSLAKFVAFVSSGVVAFFGSISILEGREETDKQIKARFLTTWEERFDDCIYIYIYILFVEDRPVSCPLSLLPRRIEPNDAQLTKTAQS